MMNPPPVNAGAMTNLTTARLRVKECLQQLASRINLHNSELPAGHNCPKYDFIIVSEQEHDFGWVFFWDNKQFMESGDRRYSLSPKVPFIVDRKYDLISNAGESDRLEDVNDFLKNYSVEYRKDCAKTA